MHFTLEPPPFYLRSSGAKSSEKKWIMTKNEQTRNIEVNLNVYLVQFGFVICTEYPVRFSLLTFSNAKNTSIHQRPEFSASTRK